MKIKTENINKLVAEVRTLEKEKDFGNSPSYTANRQGRIEGIRTACRLLGIEKEVFGE